MALGPQEMLDRAEVKNKWQLTPLKNFRSPRLYRAYVAYCSGSIDYCLLFMNILWKDEIPVLH